MFDLPPHVDLSEWVTALVLIAATAGAAVRAAGAYSTRLAAGVAAVLLAVDALLVWAVLRNDSVRRQRALESEYVSE
ncbi:hypothetical protein [Halorussus sp. AFM4]|uniref:hypothetical protein n=1 Tax=Halorussus sp. AFM4 TaxID=3421651 RepID=UPI003EBD3C62